MLDLDDWESDSGPGTTDSFGLPQDYSPNRRALARSQTRSRPSCSLSDTTNIPTHLGDFDAVFKGLAEYDKLQAQKQEEQKKAVTITEAVADELPEPDSSLVNPKRLFDQEDDRHTIRQKEVRWEDDVLNNHTLIRNNRRHRVTGRQAYLEEFWNISECRKKSRRNSIKKQDAQLVRPRLQRYKASFAEDDESETDVQLGRLSMSDLQPLSSSINSTKKGPAIVGNLLTPAWVTPIITRPKVSQLTRCSETPIFDGYNITPLVKLTRLQKQVEIIRLLSRKLGHLCFDRVDPLQKFREWGGNVSQDGIHVFVDSSNIAIGFYESLKRERGIDIEKVTRRSPLAFHSLAFILERGRPVAKRILVGSSDSSGVRPEYMNEAERCGYEINMLERVTKYKEDRPRRKTKSTGNGYGTSGQSSGSESGRSGRKRTIEQAVDEIAHMKMLESMLDYAEKPSTIVLATGDAAEAEFSGGFLVMIKRALARGWKVEVIAWGSSMNYLYRSENFLKQWKEQFMVIELEGFAELLLDICEDPGRL